MGASTIVFGSNFLSNCPSIHIASGGLDQTIKISCGKYFILTENDMEKVLYFKK